MLDSLEGRDEPVINKDVDAPMSGAASSASASSFTSDPGQWTDSNVPPQRRSNDSIPQRGFTNDFHTNQTMFDRDFPDFPKHGSIFERAKEFPVRNDFFNRRSESPGKQVPVFHTANSQPQQQNFTNQNVRHSPSPATQNQPQKNQDFKQGHAVPNQQPCRQQTPQPNPQQNEEQKLPHPSQQKSPQEKTFEKIQLIQLEVLNLIEKVEKFTGTSKKDKEYLYLDEMFTQELCKLDIIETFGDENLKKSRREVVTAINHAIGVLDSKVNAAASVENSYSNANVNNSGQEGKIESNNSNKSLYDNMSAKSSENLPQQTSQLDLKDHNPNK